MAQAATMAVMARRFPDRGIAGVVWVGGREHSRDGARSLRSRGRRKRARTTGDPRPHAADRHVRAGAWAATLNRRHRRSVPVGSGRDGGEDAAAVRRQPGRGQRGTRAWGFRRLWLRHAASRLHIGFADMSLRCKPRNLSRHRREALLLAQKKLVQVGLENTGCCRHQPAMNSNRKTYK